MKVKKTIIVGVGASTTRMAGTFVFYHTFSLTKTPGILRMVDDHPYESVDLLRG